MQPSLHLASPGALFFVTTARLALMLATGVSNCPEGYADKQQSWPWCAVHSAPAHAFVYRKPQGMGDQAGIPTTKIMMHWMHIKEACQQGV